MVNVQEYRRQEYRCRECKVKNSMLEMLSMQIQEVQIDITGANFSLFKVMNGNHEN